jgi:hypothetical protein
MGAFSKKGESRPDNIVRMDEVQRRAISLTRSFVHDLVNQLAVIVGHCDLVSDDLKQGSQAANRLLAIREIGQGMAQELNEYQYRLSKSVRSVGTQKRDVA